MGISVGKCLERNTMLVRVKECMKKKFAACKNYMVLSKKNTQMYILDSQSSLPGDPNGVFWVAQK